MDLGSHYGAVQVGTERHPARTIPAHHIGDIDTTDLRERTDRDRLPIEQGQCPRGRIEGASDWFPGVPVPHGHTIVHSDPVVDHQNGISITDEMINAFVGGEGSDL